MTSQKTLKLYEYVDGVNDTLFPDAENQIEIGAFRYDAKRMGGAPTITASVNYPTCLDDEWTDMVYTELNGERYFLKQTPTSSKSNDDARYKHDLEFVAERTILDNSYFYDAVIGKPLENDKPVTNSTKFHFYGNIEEYVRKMNHSLQYTALQEVDEEGNVLSGYHVVLDADIVTRDNKQISFDNAVFSQALQECYNQFGIPFYFDGKTIHVGFTNNVIEDILEYGVDGALLSATKTNANFKVVNRATGEGSSDNIPYYYPNNSPKGDIRCEVSSVNPLSVSIVDHDLYSNKIGVDDAIEYKGSPYSLGDVEHYVPSRMQWDKYTDSSIVYLWFQATGAKDSKVFRRSITTEGPTSVTFFPSVKLTKGEYSNGAIVEALEFAKVQQRTSFKVYKKSQSNTSAFYSVEDATNEGYTIEFAEAGEYYIETTLQAVNPFVLPNRVSISLYMDYSDDFYDNIGWYYNDTRVELEGIGLSVSGDASIGDTITQRLDGEKITTSTTLQPSIYRATGGKERFYNAINYPFPYEEGYEFKYGEYIKDGEVHNDAYIDDAGNYYRFTNEYKEGRPREHVFTVDDIKPTIKEATNNISWMEEDEEGEMKQVFQRIDMFSEFAYDIDDNDETYIDPNGNTSYKHPYFFAKLRKLDFNLFDHASESGAMTISMTMGHCGACNFEIGVSKDEPQFNPVQVYEQDETIDGVLHKKGSLKYDKNGYVRCGLEDWQDAEWPQDMQQDTVNNEVWIALKKDDNTYGILMPKAPKYKGEELVSEAHRPVACSSAEANDGDTFVILNINLPEEYIYKNEKKLERAIVKYIWENNAEKFNFSVNFSRIFLEENPDILRALNENARLTRVKYNGDEYILYVSSYSYVMNEGDILPEIRIELDDTLTISQNALQEAINEVKGDITNAINSIDVASIGSRYFLRKDTYDVAEAPIDFRGGVYFGDGGDVSYLEDGSAKMTIDFLEVTKKATFTSLEIQEKTHAGGQILVTPAAMVCSNVEETEDAYRCYFQNKGENGEDIYNQFVEGDQAISQTFNEWGGHYYWRLVTGIGENYIDLSKTDCASESGIPNIGDRIIQLGNRVDTSRQAAQVLSTHGENSPSFIMYNAIDSFSLEGKNITGIIWNPETQEPQMYSYGDFFFGDRKLDGNYITFQQREGETEKTLVINADVELGSNSTGLSNLSEWKSQDAKVTQAVNDASSARQSASVAQGEASEAKRMASSAQSLANTANAKLNEWADDSIISPIEKQGLKDELAFVVADFNEIEKNYEKYIQEFDTLILSDDKQYITEDGYIFNIVVANANWTAFRNAYNAYSSDLQEKINASGEVAVGNLRNLQSTFYEARTSILEDIALSIKAEADYSKARANKAISDVENLQQKVVEDYDYLREAFGNAKSMSVQGVVMSQMVAVADVEEGESVTDGEVEAFLNGSDVFSDTEHGKLILAGGIPQSVEVDGVTSTDLNERAKKAATRVYEKGRIDTNDIHLENGCTIGDTIKVTNDGFVLDGLFSGSDIKINQSRGFHSTNRAGVSTAMGGLLGQGIEITSEEGLNFGVGQSYASPFGMTFTMGEYEEAIRVHSGQFGGLRPKMRRITTDDGLSIFDHTIECTRNDGGAIELELPDFPSAGQCYEIWKWGYCDVYINGLDEILRIGVSSSTRQGVGREWLGVIKLLYSKDEQKWLMTLCKTE